jgi:chromate transporter
MHDIDTRSDSNELSPPRGQQPSQDTASTTGAWKTWLLIGATGFGGPAGQVAILHREVVERHKWLDEDEFLAAMRLCMLLPGPEAQQLATYAGWRLDGIAGGLLAGTLFVLPGAILVTALAWLHAVGESVPLIAAAFAGTRPAVLALVALAAWRIGRKSIRSAGVAAVAVAALAALAAGVSFPLVVLGAGIIGWLVPLEGGRAADATATPVRGAPEPSGWRSGIRHALAVASISAVIWAVCYAVVRLLHLAGGQGADAAILFTETTLLSLGGAYAVVPWALDESLARNWLAPAERFDALAMGEATPGPLILVVTFIGFLAGWKTQPAGDAVAGLEGAAIATLFAFIPSFAMVLALAPLVRSIKAGSGLSRAMTAIGAAVVAAIVLLGVKLGIGALVPQGRIEIVPLVVAIASGVALVRGWVSTPIVVLASAAIGMIVRLLG